MTDGGVRPAIILGGDISGLAVLRSLGRAGIPTFDASGGRRLLRLSLWHRELTPPVPDGSDSEALAVALDRLPFERAVVFPCSDRWAAAAAALPEATAVRFPAVVPPAAALATLVDKGTFARTAASLGIPHPQTRELDSADDLDGLSDDDVRGAFLKPRDSHRFASVFHRKAFRVADLADARSLVEQAQRHGLGLLLQEYLAGPPSRHVFLDGYVDRSGRMRALLARRRLRMFPADFGNSSLSETIPLGDVDEAVDSLTRLFEGIGFSGLFDAEFKEDAEGRFRILEVNGRPWWQLALMRACGLDVCSMAYDDALGLPVADGGSYPVGRRWVYPLLDVRAWLAARGGAESGGGAPPLAWRGATQAVFERRDPLPVVDELAGAASILVRRARARVPL